MSSNNPVLFCNPVWTVNNLIGQPNSGGKIYFYNSNNPTQFKTVYKDSSLTTAWPNPILFDITGAQDDNYPIYGTNDGPYRVEITDSNNTPIKTFDPFPYLGNDGPLVPDVEINNQIANGQFKYWRNQSYSPVPLKILGVAPNFDFIKSNTSATDTLSFVQNILGQTNIPGFPEWYLQYICTGPGSGETQKDLIAYLSDAFAYSGAEMTFSLWGISPTSNDIEVIFIQNFGTNAPSTPVVTTVGTLSFNPQWKNYTLTFTVPSVSGKILSSLNDGYTAIALRFPLNAACNVGVTNLGLYFGQTAPDYQYQNDVETKSSIVAVEYPLTNTVNTDDGCYIPFLKKGNQNLTLNSWAGIIVELGFAFKAGLDFLRCDGSSIYSQDYYNLANAISTDWGIGTQGFYSNTPNGVQISGLTNGVQLTHAQDLNTHMKVYTVYPGAVSISAPVYQIICNPGALIPNSSYLFISSSTVNYCIWFNLNGTGTNPAIVGRTAIMVPYVGNETPAQIAVLISTAIGSIFTCLVPTNTLSVVCSSFGIVNPVSAGNSNFILTQVEPGTAYRPGTAYIQIQSTTYIPNSYFTINSPSNAYYVWLSKNNQGKDPGSLPILAGKIGIKVIYIGTETVEQMLALIAQQLINAQVLLPGLQGLFTRNIANGSANDPDRNARISLPNVTGANAGDNVGSYQSNQNLSHAHQVVITTHVVAGGSYGGVGSGNEGSGAAGTPVFNSANSGGNQSNPNNAYVDKVILY